MSPLSEELRAYFQGHAAEVERELCAAIESEGDRFSSQERLLRRFRDSVALLMDRGLGQLNGFIEAHNELCVAVLVLEDPNEPTCIRLDYEPTMSSCSQKFDFRAVLSSGSTVWIEVKTIRPTSQDDWERFERVVESGYIPRNVRVTLDQDWLGGELFHNMYAARSKMLQYSLETEGKITSCLSSARDDTTLLAFFSDGFRWHLDELEDFVAFYLTGHYWPGDPFQDMQQHYMTEHNITFTRNIKSFAFIRRPIRLVRPDRVMWKVEPPALPG